MSKKKKKNKSFAPDRSGGGAVGDINVTPLIDIVLVLLIIYMVVTPVMTHQMDINLPEKTKEQLLVATCEDNSYAFNRMPLDLNELKDRLRKKIIKKRAAGEKVVIFVDSHPEANYPSVVKLMDSVRDAGNEANTSVKIGLASLKDPKDFIACTPPKKKAPAPVEGLPVEGQEG